ncbi:MAG: ABC transporter permease [Candidatus Kapabacteria bacterium]|nr:ABC transporter permease [Candidatus Kapabacteria bacterium]
MFEYILKRILLFIPTLFLITAISFGISRLAPGDPAAAKAAAGADGSLSGNNAVNEKTIELIRKQWNLDKPVWQQYLIWTTNIFKLDFGTSFQDSRPITEKFVERIPITLLMNILAIILSYSIAVPLGIYSATHQGNFLDKLSTFFIFALYSLPTFWIGTMGITFLCNPEYVSWFPSGNIRSINFDASWGFLEKLTDYASHLVLPMIVYTYGSFAYISRQMRSGMLEVIRQDYIRTARAKGLPEHIVIFKHAVRNSLIPIITLLAGILPALIGGSVIIETIFSIPGMGKLSFESLIARDYPMIMAIFTVSAVMTLVGILVADILYSVVDPRIAYGKKS